MKILGIYDQSAPKYWRILLPLHGMPGIEFQLKNKVVEEDFNGIDLLFINRCHGKVQLKGILNMREKYGFKMVVDLDDHWLLDPTHMLYWQYQKEHISDIIELYVKYADAVTVTHDRLYKEVLPINKNVHILPNSIPKVDQFLFKKSESDKIRLFWAGGVTHQKDVELLRNPIKRINNDKVRWVMGGYQPKRKECEAMATVFTNGGKFDYRLLEFLPVHQYYAVYSECDISLIPLVDNSFNQYKSNLKILEAANIGAPVVVSHVHPYIGFPEQLVNYVRSQGDWYKKVKWCLDNPEELREQAANLKNYVDIHYNFEAINKHRREIFEYVRS